MKWVRNRKVEFLADKKKCNCTRWGRLGKSVRQDCKYLRFRLNDVAERNSFKVSTRKIFDMTRLTFRISNYEFCTLSQRVRKYIDTVSDLPLIKFYRTAVRLHYSNFKLVANLRAEHSQRECIVFSSWSSSHLSQLEYSDFPIFYWNTLRYTVVLSISIAAQSGVILLCTVYRCAR